MDAKGKKNKPKCSISFPWLATELFKRKKKGKEKTGGGEVAEKERSSVGMCI